MGIGGIGIWQLLIILVIVLLLFGTKRLRSLGGDLGGAIKGFKKAMTDDKANQADAENPDAVSDPADMKKVTGEPTPAQPARPETVTPVKADPLKNETKQ